MEWISYRSGIMNHAPILAHLRVHFFHRESIQKAICDMYTIRTCAVSYRLNFGIHCTNMVCACNKFNRQLEINKLIDFHKKKHIDLIDNFCFCWDVLFIGIPADYYSTPQNIYGDSANNPDNSCFDTEDYKAPRGLQNISPCQYSKC